MTAGVEMQRGLDATTARLLDALRRSVPALAPDEAETHAALLAHVDRPSSASLAARLATFAVLDPGHRVPLADVLGLAADALAPTGRPPSDAAGSSAWQAVLSTVDRLYGTGSALLGRPSSVDAERLAALVAESRTAPRRDTAAGHSIGEPGPALRELAVDPALRAEVEDALGCEVVPSYRAVYVYLHSCAAVPFHVDHRDYEVIFHLTLEHSRPVGGGERAALVVHRAERPPKRLPLGPGEALALRGRGSIHHREPLRPGERWSSVAVGFQPARADGQVRGLVGPCYRPR